MNCQQVDKMLYLFCDGRLHPYLRSQIEKHLENCPGCRNNLAITSMETEVLRLSDDIPPLSGDFCQKVMLRVTEGCGTEVYGSRTKRNTFSELKNRFNPGIVGGIVAVLVLLALIIKSPVLSVFEYGQSSSHLKHSADQSISVGSGQSPKAQQLTAGVRERKAEPGEAETTADSEPQLNAPDYGRASTDASTHGRSAPSFAPQVSATNMTSRFTVVRPYYIPAGYYLARAESDTTGALSLIYATEDGSQVHVLVRPTGGDDETSPLVPSKMSTLSGSDSETVPGTVTKSSFVDSQQQARSEAGGAQNNESVVSCTVYVDDQCYRIEVSGSLPVEELARIADSCK
ncbi:MAG TPA: zf-HC2 domain-containing protein [Syntrophothermus lipocalidus]|nr:zf-HC2 domain-containing protein [Syntrophothermus lipocalidus]